MGLVLGPCLTNLLQHGCCEMLCLPPSLWGMVPFAFLCTSGAIAGCLQAPDGELQPSRTEIQTFPFGNVC